jgi:serine/threonine protein phosphatase PrpC
MVFDSRARQGKNILVFWGTRVLEESTSQRDASSSSLMPLVPGTTLLDRYTIVELVSSSGAANVYLVAPTRACSVCEVENQGDATECGFCGSELPEVALLRLIEQRAPSDARALPPSSFQIGDCVYSLTPDENATPSNDAAPMLKLYYGLQTDPGLKRGAFGEPNEDSIAAVTLEAHDAHDKTLGLFLLADGVGGAAAGEVASELALRTLTHEWVNRILLPVWNGTTLSDEQIRAKLHAGIGAANERLLEYQSEHNLLLGTTLTAALVLNRDAYIVNIGDSRTYLYRQGKLAAITRDHSYVATLVANGTITPDAVYDHPQRNLILRSLGDVTAAADIFPEEGGALQLEAGDQLLLCCDGLWEMVRDAEICRVLKETTEPQLACAQLVQLANLAGGADNISVIVIRFDRMTR